jgi:hypothetical protein
MWLSSAKIWTAPDNGRQFTFRRMTGQEDQIWRIHIMSNIIVTVSREVAAPAAIVYNILADYNHHHPNILPPNAFAGLEIEEGGIGAGTEILVHFNVMGIKQQRRLLVTEPEPGVVLAETDVDTDLITTFTVQPIGAAQSKVTIESVWQPEPGLQGLVDRLTTPFFMRRIYREELDMLNAYAQQQAKVRLGDQA